MKASAATRKSGGKRLPVQYVAAQVMAESATAAEGIPRILEAICGSLACEHGAVWNVDRSLNVLRYLVSWHVPGAGFAEFDSASRPMTLAPGKGLPGRVWSSRQPVWLSDVPHGEDQFPRRPIALKEGIHCAFGFPIMLAGEILGVMEFFSRKVRRPDPKVLQTLGAIGSQVGQFLERKRSEEELRASEERFRNLFEEAPVAYHEIDTEGIVRRVNRAERELLGLEAAANHRQAGVGIRLAGGSGRQPRCGAAEAVRRNGHRSLRARVRRGRRSHPQRGDSREPDSRQKRQRDRNPLRPAGHHRAPAGGTRPESLLHTVVGHAVHRRFRRLLQAAQSRMGENSGIPTGGVAIQAVSGFRASRRP